MADPFPHLQLDHISISPQQSAGRKRPPKPSKYTPPYFSHGADRPAHATQLNKSLSSAQNAAIHARSLVPEGLRAEGFSAVAVSIDAIHPLPLAELQVNAELLQFHSSVSKSNSDPDEPEDKQLSNTERAVLWITNSQLTKLSSDISAFV